MPFGPEMRVTIPAGEVVLGPIDEDQLDTLPSIDDVPEVTRYVTQHFIEQARTFKGDKSYFRELRDAPENPDDRGKNWFIRLQREMNGETLDEVVGFTGYRNRQADESGITSVDTRMVLMQPHLLGKGIGGAAGMARTFYALEHDGIDILRANVDLNNEASYKLVRRLGYTCIYHFETPPDPARHKVELHNPHSALILPRQTAPYREDDMNHGEHDLSWTAPRLRAVRTLEIARNSIRFTA